MKRLMKKIRMRRRTSKVNSKSHDPIKAYKARIEVRIYDCLLDLIAKELETEQKAPKSAEPKRTAATKPAKTTVTETVVQAEVQIA